MKHLTTPYKHHRQQPIWIEFKNIFIVLGAILLIIIGAAGTIIYLNVTAPPSEIEVATTMYKEDLPPEHITQFSSISEVEEDTNIPRTNGPHTAQTYPWRTFSAEEIDHNQVIHNLEHGGTVIYYDPGLSNADKTDLEELSEQGAFVIAPRSDIDTEIVALSWGRSFTQDTLDITELKDFHDEWKNKSPEKLAF